ncbi:MAG: hypothetical protein F4X35_00115 [Alphaproteobacteria bacterium]|nr:hypothetical protein [Alphaproteobacteria bacterium]
MSYRKADADVAMQLGDDYIHLSGDIASLTPTMQANISEYPLVGEEFPLHVVTGYSGGLEASGLMGDTGRDVYTQDSDDNSLALFCILHKGGKLAGPVGYARINNRNIVDSDGVFVVNANSAAVPDGDFTRWQYGTIIPNQTNTDKNAGSGGYPAPVAGQWVLFNVVKAGNLRTLELRYRKDTTVWSLEARTSNSRLVPGLTLGQLRNGTNVVPASQLTGGQWRLQRGGSPGNAEFYVCPLHPL